LIFFSKRLFLDVVKYFLNPIFLYKDIAFKLSSKTLRNIVWIFSFFALFKINFVAVLPTPLPLKLG
jgi:hypothetical protein